MHLKAAVEALALSISLDLVLDRATEEAFWMLSLLTDLAALMMAVPMHINLYMRLTWQV